MTPLPNCLHGEVEGGGARCFEWGRAVVQSTRQRVGVCGCRRR
jgi:hypothetical protein